MRELETMSSTALSVSVTRSEATSSRISRKFQVPLIPRTVLLRVYCVGRGARYHVTSFQSYIEEKIMNLLEVWFRHGFRGSCYCDRSDRSVSALYLDEWEGRVRVRYVWNPMFNTALILSAIAPNFTLVRLYHKLPYITNISLVRINAKTDFISCRIVSPWLCFPVVFRGTSSITIKEHYVVWYGAILLLAADVDFGNCNIMFT